MFFTSKTEAIQMYSVGRWRLQMLMRTSNENCTYLNINIIFPKLLRILLFFLHLLYIFMSIILNKCSKFRVQLTCYFAFKYDEIKYLLGYEIKSVGFFPSYLYFKKVELESIYLILSCGRKSVF